MYTDLKEEETMWNDVRNERRRPQPRHAERQRRRQTERLLRAAERSVARGRLEAGIRRYLEIADREPGNLAHLNRLGDLMARAGRRRRAVALFAKVADTYADQGFWAKAIAINRKILRCDPGRRDVEARLAHLYRQSGLPT